MAKKLTKEEVEQDALLNSYARTQEFYLNNKSVIIGSAVVVLLAIALALGYHYYKKKENQKAEQKMGMAEDFYLRGQYDQALNGSKQNYAPGFKQIINDYSSTKAGNLAHYYAAVSAYHLGNTKNALSFINDYEIPDGILGVAPLSFKGILLRTNGKNQQAAETFVQAAELDKNNSTTPYNYLEAAEAYQDAADSSKAKKYARKIVDNYPDSPQVADAHKLLGQLSVKAAQ